MLRPHSICISALAPHGAAGYPGAGSGGGVAGAGWRNPWLVLEKQAQVLRHRPSHSAPRVPSSASVPHIRMHSDSASISEKVFGSPLDLAPSVQAASASDVALRVIESERIPAHSPRRERWGVCSRIRDVVWLVAKKAS
ncbi:hypothetical protein DFH07DRAFT_1058437 [Mycena maculata]|uniref:Uncharacterized protein n=1 Tax=Mycena maculata TaxID=230809 RepID=A0AAD7JNI4_9AGAR|nr:hypothetical protein DFH07DRAFT_1058437 [Mycena maculata]